MANTFLTRLAHRFIALEAELFAEGGVRVAGWVLGIDGELEFAAAGDLGALVSAGGVHAGAREWGGEFRQ